MDEVGGRTGSRERVAAVAEYFADRVVAVRALAGGCISQVVVVELATRGPVVVKGLSEGSLSEGKEDFFPSEAAGLQELRRYTAQGGPRVPEVYWVTSQLLCLEYLPPGALDQGQLAGTLAQLHGCRGSSFGWDQDNFIGGTPQANVWSQEWGEFFVDLRLAPQLARNGLSAMEREFKGWRGRIVDALNDHRPWPAPCHGDLWRGNAWGSAMGACVIDPAFYFADREVDIAMTELFGGFSCEFYQTYQAHTPLPEGYLGRKLIYNWYHLLNHRYLFGASYHAAVEDAWRAIKARF